MGEKIEERELVCPGCSTKIPYLVVVGTEPEKVLDEQPLWECENCGYQFTATDGATLHRSGIGFALMLDLGSKGGEVRYDIEVTKQEIDNAMLLPGEYRRVGDKYYIPRGMLDGYDASPLPPPTPIAVEIGSKLGTMRDGVVMQSIPADPDFVEIVAVMKGLTEEIRMLRAEMKGRRSDAG